MKTTNKSIFNYTINYIQLKLFDFVDGKPNFDEILKKSLNEDISSNTNNSIELDENNIFIYVNPSCPNCGYHKIIKKGTVTKNKQNMLGKVIEFKEQQY